MSLVSRASQQMTFSSPEYRWTTSLNKLDSAFSSLCMPLSSHFLFDSSVFSHWYFIVPLRDMRLTILTCKELRCKSLTFTIFIIQSQVGAIPVFSRLCLYYHPPYSFFAPQQERKVTWEILSAPSLFPTLFQIILKCYCLEARHSVLYPWIEVLLKA